MSISMIILDVIIFTLCFGTFMNECCFYIDKKKACPLHPLMIPIILCESKLNIHRRESREPSNTQAHTHTRTSFKQSRALINFQHFLFVWILISRLYHLHCHLYIQIRYIHSWYCFSFGICLRAQIQNFQITGWRKKKKNGITHSHTHTHTFD